MELNQIKYFIMTAQLQNMSKAAQALNIAQPTLSKSLASLEKELGVQLFDRSGRKLILNDRGKLFLAGAKSSIEELDHVTLAIKARVTDSTLNIGLFCMSERFMNFLAAFSNNNPGLLFNINNLHGDLAHIDTNEYDVLLYPRNSLFRRYRGKYAYTEKYLVAVYRENPLAAKGPLNLIDLREENMIFMKYDAKAYENAYALYLDAVGERENYNFCNSHELQRLMISSNQGIGFVPEESAGAYRSDENIVLVPIADERFERDVLIGFKREKHLSACGRQFVSYLTECFELETEE